MAPKGGTEYPLTPGQGVATPSGGEYMVAGVRASSWFGPLQPMRPMAPQSVSGRVRDYAVGENIQINPRSDRAVSFSQLRALADGCDVLRTVIETRKDQVAAMDWRIKKRTKAKGKKQEDDSEDPKRIALEKFFRQPSRDYDFDEWMRVLLEDLLVLDAAAIYKWRLNSGQIYSLDPMDAATIKLLIDDSGRRPVPPSPAYQQILKGIQAVDYMKARDREFDASRALKDPEKEIEVEQFAIDELIYKARNMRTWTPYGYSPVEQIIVTINTAIRRALHQLAYYTEGNMSDQIIGLPAEWTPDMISDFQRYWDSVNEGNSKERRKGRFVSGDAKVTAIREPALKDEYDEWIARVICFAFSIPPTPFVRQMNRASAELQQDTAQEEGLEPLLRWIKTFMDKIIVNDFGDLDYEFSWQDDEEVDLEKQATADKTYISCGVLDQNEVREKLGKEPRPEAGKLGIVTAGGFIPLDSPVATGGGGTVGLSPGQVKGGINVKGTENNSGMAGKNAPAGNPEQPKKKIEKAASVEGLKKKHTGLNLNRPIVIHAKSSAAKKIKHVFDQNKRRIQAALRHSVSKAADDEANHYPLMLDLSALAGISDDMALVAQDSGAITIGELTTDATYNSMFNRLNERAQAWAEQRSAELVTQVTDTTRRELQSLIAKSMDDNIGRKGLADELDGWNGFSEARAALIANTEIGNANGQGSLEGLRAAEDLGVAVKKQWLSSESACDICQGNEEDGPIDLGDDFSSGDDAPLAHPNCTCTMIGVTESGEEEQAWRLI